MRGPSLKKYREGDIFILGQSLRGIHVNNIFILDQVCEEYIFGLETKSEKNKRHFYLWEKLKGICGGNIFI